MKITKIPLALHQLGRFREILAILIKYDFGEFVHKSGFGKHIVTKKRLKKIESINRHERIRMAIEEMGPTFIKFGQILADRPDLISVDLRAELKKLQDGARPLDDEIAVEAIETELNKPIDEVFREFNTKHIASASIGQAYTGTLKSGEKVVIKIQRPGIEKKILLDLDLLGFVASWAQKNNPDFQIINLEGVVEEFGKALKEELNFNHEATNVMRFGHIFGKDNTIYVPKVFKDFSTSKLLIEEFIEGIKVDNIEGLLEEGHDPELIAHRGARLMFKQIFVHGFFHADPHPGNIFIRDKNIISFIDFGMMGSLRPYHMDFLGKYVLGYVQRDSKKITSAMLLLCGRRHYDKFDELEFEISDMMKQYQFLSMKEMDFNEILNRSIDIIVHFGLNIPPTIFLLIKALVTIEGVAAKLNPKFDIAKEMAPFARELLKRQFDPLRHAQSIFGTLSQYAEFFRNLPSALSEIVYKTKEGKLKIIMEHQGLEPMIKKLDLVSKRISISIILAALIIGASIVSLWEHSRWIGSVIFVLAGIVGFWTMIKLLRKGGL
jgi:ubiquinone biosynthesis protein